jgi:hypothetical protein
MMLLIWASALQKDLMGIQQSGGLVIGKSLGQYQRAVFVLEKVQG